jgi:hypothetical protein
MSGDLVLCPSCTRHVRREEPRCPFCGAAVPEATRAAIPRVAPAGLSRAKLYAFHAAMATGVAATACGATTAVGTDAAVPADASDGSSADAGGQDATADTSTTGDTGSDAIADAKPDWGPPPPPYGCVFPEGCGDVKV